jgi:hypothetical protein
MNRRIKHNHNLELFSTLNSVNAELNATFLGWKLHSTIFPVLKSPIFSRFYIIHQHCHCDMEVKYRCTNFWESPSLYRNSK